MPRTRNMAREIGNKVAKVLIKCLVVEGTTPRFRWFDYDAGQWDRIVQILETVLPAGVEIQQDPNTLGQLFQVWNDTVNEADADRRAELNIAALAHLQDLQFEDTGREAWYAHVKTQAEAPWTTS